ncbi:MAG: zinc-dependent metalloprotease family protein [Bacteroidia bacterium]
MKSAALMICCLLGCVLAGMAQAPYWQVRPGLSPTPTARWQVLPDDYRVLTIDTQALALLLARAPGAYSSLPPVEVLLPLPDGTVQRVGIERSLTMPAALGERYGIRTFQGQGIDDPGLRVRLEQTPEGLHGMIQHAGRLAFIEPHSGAVHLAYWDPAQRDGVMHAFVCETEDLPLRWDPAHTTRSTGGDILLYRMAIAGDELYTAFHGGVAGALAAIAVVLNRVNGIYEREAGIQFQLIPNNDLIIFTGPDNYTQGDNGAMLLENQVALDGIIGDANYDIGHVFTQITAGSVGRARLNSVCVSGQKAQGVSGFGSPQGDGFILTAVVHEMGHQFSATHTFNTDTPSNNCGSNRTGITAYEPGSGSTLMSYAGACPPHNVATDADDYYHSGSLAQILAYTRQGAGGCATVIPTGNSDPVVTVPQGGFFIPRETPFELTGTATDAAGDSLTYCWDQMNIGPGGHPNFPVGDAPLFRSFYPTPIPSRTFPRLPQLVTNSQQIGEILPATARNMNFRLTVRDQIGGIAQADLNFRVTDLAGPFLVAHPNTALPVAWVGGAFEEVRWEVAGTDRAPVNCDRVRIRLSTDGGFSYPLTLADSLPNTGSAWVRVPELSSSLCRVRVEAVGNVFFDISNTNFAIQPATTAGFDVLVAQDSLVLCAGSATTFAVYTSAQLGYADSLTGLFVGLPDGVEAAFVPETLAPGATMAVTLSGDTAVQPGFYPVSLVVLAASGSLSEVRPLVLQVLAPMLPVALPAFPVNGTAVGTSGLLLGWSGTADSYTVELATTPGFGGSVVWAQAGIATPYVVLPFDLDPQTVYYWRVQSRDACGTGPFSEVYAFETGSCQTLASTQVPVTIPAFGNPATATSTLMAGGGAAIGWARVALRGTHPKVDQLTASLRSPAGTEVPLFAQLCTSLDADFRLQFADDGLGQIACPPVQNLTYAPLGGLSAVVGENPAGTWTLTIRDLVNFDAGSLDAWELDLCADGPEGPRLITNDPLLTQAWRLDTLVGSLLEATDPSGSPLNVRYTLLRLPHHGGLLLGGSNLSAGDTFSQFDIESGNLGYLHNGSATVADSFRFELRNTTGGWGGVHTFRIGIASGTTRLDDPHGGLQVQVYPNPASSAVQVQVQGMQPGLARVALYNLQGIQVWQQELPTQGGDWTGSWSVQSLAAGVYVLHIRSGDRSSRCQLWVQ